MSREKQGYRDTIALLNERFPDKDMLNKNEAAQFMGVSRTTLYSYIASGKIRFNERFGLISKADLARQICV